jgi:uncharacterized membrane protein
MLSRILRRPGLIRALAFVAVAAIVLAVAADASACPTCKDGVGHADPHGRSIAAGYYYSILFMMSMPFIILTTFGSFAYRSVKKAQRDAALKQSGDA